MTCVDQRVDDLFFEGLCDVGLLDTESNGA
jgi:hypothetical protein